MGAIMMGAIMMGAIMMGAIMMGAIMMGAIMMGAIMMGAIMMGAMGGRRQRRPRRRGTTAARRLPHQLRLLRALTLLLADAGTPAVSVAPGILSRVRWHAYVVTARQELDEFYRHWRD
eukprot:gene3685-10269_t